MSDKQDTFWKVGDKVYARFVGADILYEIIGVELSSEPYFENGMSDKKIKPQYPVEWCKCKAPDGDIREFAGHQLVRAES